MYELSSSSNDKQLLYNSMVWAGGKMLYPPVPPDPPQDLWISVVGADLQLDWTVVSPEPDVRFNIFKSLTVDGFNFALPEAQVPAPPWTDPGAAADTSNYFYIVRAINISSSLTETNTDKVGKFYLSSLLAGSIRVEPEEILLGHCNYKVDERPVVIRGSRVLRARAKIPEWTVQFTIIYNKNLPEGTIELLKQILEDAGTRLGLLDYRPQHKGWFGTFTVENYEVAA